MMEELAAHVVDIDIYHTQQDKWAYNHGLFWHTYHYGDADTATHRSYPRAGAKVIGGGGPSPDQNYTSGLMLHYFLTGDAASRETVIDLGAVRHRRRRRLARRSSAGWIAATPASRPRPGRTATTGPGAARPTRSTRCSTAIG